MARRERGAGDGRIGPAPPASARAGAPAAAPAAGEWHNWSGIQSCRPAAQPTPASADERRAAAAQLHRPVRLRRRGPLVHGAGA